MPDGDSGTGKRLLKDTYTRNVFDRQSPKSPG